VPGLDHIWSVTSRGTAEVDLFFNWKSDMYRTLELVNAALARVQSTLPPTAKITANRLTFAAFPIMGYSLTSDTVPQTRIWEMATYDLKPRLNRTNRRFQRGGARRAGSGVSDRTGSRQAGRNRHHGAQHSGLARPQQLVDSPGLIETNHQLVLSLVSGQTRTSAESAMSS